MLTKQQRTVDDEALSARRKDHCWVCGKAPPGDPSHIRSVGAGGPDALWNIAALCRVHHTEWHKIGSITFIRKHPRFGQKLYGMGWYLLLGKLWNDKLNASSSQNKSESEEPPGLRQELPKDLP